MGTNAALAEQELSPEPDQHKGTISTIRKGKGDDGQQFVEFILGHEYFAVNLFHTREVLTPTEITPLPNAPPYIRGVMDLRGSITTIVDLKNLMHITAESGSKKQSRIIILDQGMTEKPIGILVDDVFSVSTHKSADIDRDGEQGTNKNRNIMGVIRKTIKEGEKESHKLILWLDIHAMMKKIEKEL